MPHNRNSKNKTGGTIDTAGFPSMDDVSRLQGLDIYTKRYQDFDYNKYLGQVRLSNMTKGGSVGSLGSVGSVMSVKNILKDAYNTYMQGGASFLKKLKDSKKKQRSRKQGGDNGNNFSVSEADMMNYTNLDIGTPYQIPKLQKIPKAPYSNFGL